MAGIIFNSEATHSNNGSAIELRLRQYRSWWGNLVEIKLNEAHLFGIIRYFHKRLRTHKKIDPKKGRLAPHTDQYGVKNTNICDFCSLFATADGPPWSIGVSRPISRIDKIGRASCRERV